MKCISWRDERERGTRLEVIAHDKDFFNDRDEAIAQIRTEIIHHISDRVMETLGSVIDSALRDAMERFTKESHP